MTEVLFILVTLYVVYVVHRVTAENKAKKSEKNGFKPPVSVVQAVVKNESKVGVDKEKIVSKKVIAEKTAAKKAVVKKAKLAQINSKMPTGSLRNPETGEEAKIANSYRMLRRWIKDALVKEGLVEKVYKTNELDAAAIEKIHKAIATLKQMDKYQ